MGHNLHIIGSPVVGMSILNRLGNPTSVDNFRTMESNLFCESEESLSWAF